MDLMQVASEVFQNKLGAAGQGLDPSALQSALGGLLGDGNSIDLGDLVSKFSSGDLASLASSWLGDGANESLSVESLTSMLGSANIEAFAQSLGLNADTASQGLADTIPELVDKFSSGGNLLDAVGGTDGLMGMAKKLFS